MRIWEIEDNKAIPSDLVREQDFVMRVRRLNRLVTPALVINLVISAFDAQHGGRGPLEETQRRLREFAETKKGSYAEMSNGDAFLIWEGAAVTKTLPEEVMLVLFPHGTTAELTDKARLLYTLPADYAALRERANFYVETSRHAAETGQSTNPSQLLQSEAARGPLTAWSVDQITKLLGDINLRRYVRSQPVYERKADGSWQPLFDEYYVSIDELRRNYFPKLDIIAPEHLFLELCQALDQRLLAEMTEQPEPIMGRHLHFNISVKSVMSAVFAQFAHKIPRSEHGHIGFELHRGDLLQDFSLTLNAMMSLHREGFKVAIDSVTPDLLGYLNLALFEADYIKINVAKDRLAQLKDPRSLQALAQIPREKLIFFRCDSEVALAAGIELGVTKFQGWLIDDKARGA